MLVEGLEAAKSGCVRIADLATIHMAIGEKERGYEPFEKGLESRGTTLFYFVWKWKCFDPFRSEPRLKAILRAMGVPEELVRLRS